MSLLIQDLFHACNPSQFICSARDHKPVCPGDFTPTGMRGMDRDMRQKSVAVCWVLDKYDTNVVNQIWEKNKS